MCSIPEVIGVLWRRAGARLATPCPEQPRSQRRPHAFLSTSCLSRGTPTPPRLPTRPVPAPSQTHPRPAVTRPAMPGYPQRLQPAASVREDQKWPSTMQTSCVASLPGSCLGQERAAGLYNVVQQSVGTHWTPSPAGTFRCGPGHGGDSGTLSGRARKATLCFRCGRNGFYVGLVLRCGPGSDRESGRYRQSPVRGLWPRPLPVSWGKPLRRLPMYCLRNPPT
jgi:hypothetical protein